MTLEARIRRWYYHAECQGKALDSILIHPDDYWRNRERLRFLPIRVIWRSLQVRQQPGQ